MSLSLLCGLITLAMAVGLFAYGISSADRMRDLFGKSTYYILWILFLIWLIQCGIFLRSIAFSWKQFLRDSWPVLVVALLLTVMTATAVPSKFRVLSDEANLASVSRSMVHAKTVYNYTIAKNYYFTFTPLVAELEKRPMLYPFFAHLLHLVRGYDVKNLFLLNLLLLFFLLAATGILVRRAFSSALFPESGSVWLSALFLLLSCPIVTLTATSAGFDFFSAVFFCWSFFLLTRFIKLRTPESLAFLWINLLLLAHARYESFIFFGIVMCGLLISRRLTPDLFSRYHHVYLVAPLALVPLVFQRIICHGKYENPPGVPVFSARHLVTNLKHFFQCISDFTFFYPYPNLLLWISLALVIALGMFWYLRKSVIVSSDLRLFLALLLASLGAYLAVVFSYYLGDPKHPTSARFFVLPVAALALLPVLAHRVWPCIFSQRLLLAGSVGMLLLYFPVASEDRFTQSLELIRETEHSVQFLQRLQSRNIFVIADRPGIYSAFQYGTADFSYANKNRKELLAELDNHLYSRIVVLQQISYDTRTPLQSQVLDPEFVLSQPAAEYQITGNYFLRISYVVRPGSAPSRDAVQGAVLQQ